MGRRIGDINDTKEWCYGPPLTANKMSYAKPYIADDFFREKNRNYSGIMLILGNLKEKRHLILIVWVLSAFNAFFCT